MNAHVTATPPAPPTPVKGEEYHGFTPKATGTESEDGPPGSSYVNPDEERYDELQHEERYDELQLLKDENERLKARIFDIETTLNSKYNTIDWVLNYSQHAGKLTESKAQRSTLENTLVSHMDSLWAGMTEVDRKAAGTIKRRIDFEIAHSEHANELVQRAWTARITHSADGAEGARVGLFRMQQRATKMVDLLVTVRPWLAEYVNSMYGVRPTLGGGYSPPNPATIKKREEVAKAIQAMDKVIRRGKP
jgi:hypothetical protein